MLVIRFASWTMRLHLLGHIILLGYGAWSRGGVTITNTKGLVYEWIRDIPTAINQEKTMGSDFPAGLTL